MRSKSWLIIVYPEMIFCNAPHNHRRGGRLFSPQQSISCLQPHNRSHIYEKRHDTLDARLSFVAFHFINIMKLFLVSGLLYGCTSCKCTLHTGTIAFVCVCDYDSWRSSDRTGTNACHDQRNTLFVLCVFFLCIYYTCSLVVCAFPIRHLSFVHWQSAREIACTVYVRMKNFLRFFFALSSFKCHYKIQWIRATQF